MLIKVARIFMKGIFNNSPHLAKLILWRKILFNSLNFVVEFSTMWVRFDYFSHILALERHIFVGWKLVDNFGNFCSKKRTALPNKPNKAFYQIHVRLGSLWWNISKKCSKCSKDFQIELFRDYYTFFKWVHLDTIENLSDKLALSHTCKPYAGWKFKNGANPMMSN